MLIRPASVADAASITRIRTDSWRTAYAGVVPDAVLADLPESPRQPFIDFLGSIPDDQRMSVAERDGRVEGYAHVGPYRTDPAAGPPGQGGEVYSIYVHPECWGRGAGRRLMDDAIAELANRGLTPVRLWVLADNPRGRGFYDRYGFTLDGTETEFEMSGRRLHKLRYSY